MCKRKNMDIELVQVHYTDDKHSNEIALLLNAYASDPMGGGNPLEKHVLKNISKELSKIPHALSIICYVNNMPAGLLNCFETFSTFSCAPLINIHDLIVLKEFRGLGLSQKLLEKVEEIALSKGCCKLTLEVLSGNEIAKSSYKKFGFNGYELDPKSGSALFWQKSIQNT